MQVTIYSKPQCAQCTATYRVLDTKGIAYNIIDITENEDGFSRVQSLGYRQVPVVVAGDHHWAGFRPDMIAKIA
ncbi:MULTISPECIES: glutaredoxin-like protein NrdH [unclassified Bartonella]|uniref:glutaredoxin-like protein NrdH n=1 Tax=unclassified Bartonella TaxID=2645622 RepID=UPI0015F91B76|nr:MULTISPECIES: glutaredoxin-like protein NrdH [unclassified Bartonella]UXM96059.1 glutaredoxin-like protein NrdH [Bartonella sp. HY329]UXN07193.1 glutaredoxin-like protein NrdH [Bartonella sp. HY761]UXN10383.1 glutaredoxin-like protein NrdH [Bartonella sp. HY328]